MKICLLSAYDAMSHRYWTAALLAMFPEYRWSVHALPARHFNWRIRGNPLAFRYGDAALVDIEDSQLVVATSMTDIATLRGLYPALSRIPAIVYFHENQFCYPNRAGAGLEAKMVNLYSALSAESVVFNSEFNRASFIAGAEQMLAGFPDFAPRSCVDTIRNKSRVLAVPLNDSGERPATDSDSDALQIVWNHRWEHDKGPERLATIIAELAAANVTFKIHVVGQQFRTQPAAFAEIWRDYRTFIGNWGFIPDRSAYLRMLAGSDVVLSTALHDFQGISVLEAVHSGCIPVVPDRLAYRDLIPARFRYRSSVEHSDAETNAAADALMRLAELKAERRLPVAPSVDHLKRDALKPSYRSLFEEIARR